MGAAHRLGGDRLDLGGHVQEVAGAVDDDQPVARLEAGGEVFWHDGEAVPAEGNRRAGGQLVERGRAHGGGL